MATQATPLQNLTSLETVLKDVQAALEALRDDKEHIPFEQRGKLSGCIDGLWHALTMVQDGLKGKIERLMAIEARVEPPPTIQQGQPWARYRGTLLQCLENAATIYAYTTQEDQGDHDWRIWSWSLRQPDKDVFTFAELGPRIEARADMRGLPAILEYDPGWVGYTLHRDDGQEPQWVFAKLYLVGDMHPAAIIYRIDFENEQE